MDAAYMPLMDAKYDNVAKAIITAGWANRSNGDVESPSGAFAMFEVPAAYAGPDDIPFGLTELGVMCDAVELTDPSEMLPAGWYFAFENSDGIIHVLAGRSEMHVYGTYVYYEAMYEDWAGTDEND